jgi:hypothetical protein
MLGKTEKRCKLWKVKYEKSTFSLQY